MIAGVVRYLVPAVLGTTTDGGAVDQCEAAWESAGNWDSQALARVEQPRGT
jgi:hypothetical protein